MIEIELDGRKVQVPEGSTVMHAAEKTGTYIPHFCYHKKLSIAANCRMCLVDVEKAPKPMPACATPVTQGMIVRTGSDKAIKAQKGVMEFLLINHPLDCPICDQGGECQLQDLAVGYGGSESRYAEEKRVVFNKNVGPLVSMQEMSRCIHCTRCVRFGQEIAGIMELGMSHRGEHAEIETFVGKSVDSELSGNMIDICPVGALTSKPFRYSARPWELSRRKSISPHDSTGTNLIVQVKLNKVMRVLPLENDAVNECWLADRDRFSYEALNTDERLQNPMIKQGGVWKSVAWQTALEYIANGLQNIKTDHGADSIGLLASPHSTIEELYLAKQLVNGLGSGNIDTRLRQAEFVEPATGGEVPIRWLGTSIASLSSLNRALVVGSNLRKDHPLFAQRIRQAERKGCKVSAVVSETELTQADAWAIPLAQTTIAAPGLWVRALADIAHCLALAAKETGTTPIDLPPVSGESSESAQAIAISLMGGERKAILLGNAAAHHANASALLALAKWIAAQTGASVGYLTEAANTVGAQLVQAIPAPGGLNAAQMVQPGALKAVLMLNTEPEFDAANGSAAVDALSQAHMVVSLNAFKANMAFSDVMLPIAPFTETPGTFVNAEGRVQSFHAVCKPLGETRPAWKVLRVLGNMLGLTGFEFETAGDVLAQVAGIDAPAADGSVHVQASRLANQAVSSLPIQFQPADATKAFPVPAVAAIYQLDGLVRRAPSLQLTTDARLALESAIFALPAAQALKEAGVAA